MTSHSKRQLRDWLWEAYFAELGIDDPVNEAERILQGIQLINGNRDAARANPEIADTAKRTALQMWALISAELGDWLLSDLGTSDPVENVDEAHRTVLRSLIEIQEKHHPPTHRDGLDPAGVLLPRWLLLRLLDGLHALDHGDIPTIFAAAVTGEHGEAYEWSNARARALEHVAFIVGQQGGVGKGSARKRVALAIGASEKTIEDWERREKSEDAPTFARVWKIAETAGQMSLQDLAGKTWDASARQKLKDLQQEDLPAFGKRYREQFGSRHNQ